MLTRAPRGTRDILPWEVNKWHVIEATARRIAKRYGIQEARFPIFEHTELFQRSVGETSDIVSKEMYTFLDRGGRSITLRPEGTAPAARMYVEHKLYNGSQPVKFYYVGPFFRYDRPQAGRYRQFHQFGVEVFGTMAPEADVEVMKLTLDFFNELGLTGLELEINSVGCRKCRGSYTEKLSEYFSKKTEQLCPDCQNRFKTNPMRVLDCKRETCQETIADDVPIITDHLCQECSEHLASVKQLLAQVGATYHVNPHLVRGLDYYTKTAFEVLMPSLGAQNALGGGGRYDYLVEECGGPSTPGVGFALGLERILLALEAQGIDLSGTLIPDLFLVTAGEKAREEGFRILNVLREAGVMAEMDYENRSIRAQMKKADKSGAAYSLIIGDEELARDEVQLREMQTGHQSAISLADVKDKVISTVIAEAQTD